MPYFDVKASYNNRDVKLPYPGIIKPYPDNIMP